ncbi:chondroitin proteoglycan-2 [Aplysia californica]|uniref:Chondroitin proteoglycan-2 n=1 Tax=Aplysia californica TaxID=6500 RepID=A0ABM0K0Y2_APLCA|nr:chondroitin proteoglycan-2 [Aplysia californica]
MEKTAMRSFLIFSTLAACIYNGLSQQVELQVPPPAPSCAYDDHIEVGCWGYFKCTGGVLTTVACPVGQVLERDSLKCVTGGHTDCKVSVDCTGKKDGHYADLGDNCESYFRCFNQRFLGHFYCPSKLVFNDAKQQCDYPTNVPACLAPVG